MSSLKLLGGSLIAIVGTVVGIGLSGESRLATTPQNAPAIQVPASAPEQAPAAPPVSVEDRRCPHGNRMAARGEEKKPHRVTPGAERLEYVTPRGERIAFGRARIEMAGGPVWKGTAVEPRQEGQRITYEYGRWNEQFAIQKDTLQHMFVIREPIREEASIRVPVQTGLKSKLVDKQTVGFADEAGNVKATYRQPVAMDLKGHLQDLEFSVSGGEIAIHLPKSYMATAAYPVLIDPIVGDPAVLSKTGSVWRVSGVQVIPGRSFQGATPAQSYQMYFAVYHTSVDYLCQLLDAHGNHLVLMQGNVLGKAIKVDGTGLVTQGTDLEPVAGEIALGPLDPQYYAVAPRVTYNAQRDQYMVVWTEGVWFDCLQKDLTWQIGLYHGCCCPPVLSVYSDPWTHNARVVGSIISVDPATLIPTTVVGGIEISMSTGGTPCTPSDFVANPQDGVPIHPAVMPDVSWDGTKYVVVWQTLEFLQNPAYTDTIRCHLFWTWTRARYALFDADGGPLTVGTSYWTDLSDVKSRFFIRGDTSDLGNILDAIVPNNLINANARVYEYVPTDLMPRVSSLIHPGTDGLMGTGDDDNLGTLIGWAVNSLVFNEPKSRVRARRLPAGADNRQAGLIFDVVTPPLQIIQRPCVTAGPSLDPDDPATPEDERRNTSHFMVSFMGVDDIVFEGNIEGTGDSLAREFIGSIHARLCEETGKPVGNVIDFAIPSDVSVYLSPNSVWCREAEQYLVSWCMTDRTLFNPYARGRAYHPKSRQVQDSPTLQFVGIPTLYPIAAAGRAPYLPVKITNPDTTAHHAIVAGQENDFSANWYIKYKFPPPSPINAPKFRVTALDPLKQFTPGGSCPGMPTFMLHFESPFAPQTIVIENIAPPYSTMKWSASTSDAWLGLSPSSGIVISGGKQTARVYVDTTGLTEFSWYWGLLRLEDPTAVNSPVEICVELYVNGPPPPKPTIHVSSGLDLNYGNCYTNTLTVRNSGLPGSFLNWMIIVDNAPWLVLSQTDGLLNSGEYSAVVLTVNKAFVPPGGSAIGTLTITDPNATNDPQTCKVNLAYTEDCEATPPPGEGGGGGGGNGGGEWCFVGAAGGMPGLPATGACAAALVAMMGMALRRRSRR
jgi:hypothetical protein